MHPPILTQKIYKWQNCKEYQWKNSLLKYYCFCVCRGVSIESNREWSSFLTWKERDFTSIADSHKFKPGKEVVGTGEYWQSYLSNQYLWSGRLSSCRKDQGNEQIDCISNVEEENSRSSLVKCSSSFQFSFIWHIACLITIIFVILDTNQDVQVFILIFKIFYSIIS